MEEELGRSDRITCEDLLRIVHCFDGKKMFKEREEWKLSFIFLLGIKLANSICTQFLDFYV